jgi:adhesin transport system membrane fusion protein
MDKDISFVNSLYGQANEQPPLKLDIVFIAIISFFFFAIIWASFSEIDELARGEGKVIPANKIQTIQNLDGGIVSELLVKEGAYVKKEQALMKIDTVRFQASLEENRETYLSLLAKRTRLNGELNFKIGQKLPKLNFPKELVDISSSYIKIETNVFKNKINGYQSAVKILKYQLSQKKTRTTRDLCKTKTTKKKFETYNKTKRYYKENGKKWFQVNC